MSETRAFLEVRDLTKHFEIGARRFGRALRPVIRAVDSISFDIGEGETLGLVGESGCGKSTTGRMVVRLVEPTSGSVSFEGEDLLSLEGAALQARRRQCQFIFQDPYGSLNPRMTVERIIAEPMEIEGSASRSARRARVRDLLDIVGLASHHATRYPHEFSGGQRQRIGIARALALNPKFVVCDEPVSALDVSVQAQVLNLMLRLQQDFGLTYLFIAHDLAVVRQISTRVAVMYLGKIVEIAGRQALYNNPRHPYTRALLASVPTARPGDRKDRIVLSDDVPNPANPPSGCRFHTRCPFVFDRCRIEEPRMLRLTKAHSVACHLWSSDAGGQVVRHLGPGGEIERT